MSWTDDTGRHEGYVAKVFADGKLGGGTYSTAGLSVDDDPEGRAVLDENGDRIQWRPAAAVVAWRVCCDHVPAHVRDEDLRDYWQTPETWMSPTVWRRVYSAAEEDLAQGRIYASLDDEGSVFIDDRDDLFELIRTEWRQHIEPEDHERSIRAALDGVTKAKQLLDLEVAAARASGLSWAEIGRVAGITRQAARDRWGTSPASTHSAIPGDSTARPTRARITDREH
ncbi:hypothetical protein [Rudaeicoccus suwonensis]|uniref:Uncharacterized protein n=1 Tax=Rudaeicoccus suwonensis TaxID=657409 RepID=A0A561DVK5_9MICO|nr:hypothetical protein [Rudaeicoccus suwonensis]TWE07395.1 hypothetical protein BKA23_3408 [Rudaeicoccus suwonensis]